MGKSLKIGQKISLKRIITWTGCNVISYGKAAGSSGKYISSISTDTRTIKENDFFIPVTGQNFDGHDFLADAVKKKCCGFAVDTTHKKSLEHAKANSDPSVWEQLIILEAAGTLSFLLDIAGNYIRRFNPLVIGVTGSAGKTTTKDFIVNILSPSFNIKFTPGNLNTELGIALSVLEINKDTQFFVAELAMRAKGQIGMLSETVNLDIGAITSVGASHLEFFKDVNEIALAKAEMADFLKEKGGVLFLNNDDEYTGFIMENVSCRIIKYGRNNNLEYNFLEKGADNSGRYDMELFNSDRKVNEFMVPVPGYHNIYNACCAAAVCSYLGVDKSTIKNGIEGTAAGENRMRIIERGGKIIINDCYNASPLSMKCAIDTLKTVTENNNCRSVAILADMMELGSSSAELHFEIGKYIKEKAIDVLIAIGDISKNICIGFGREIKAGENERNAGRILPQVYHFKDSGSFADAASDIIKPGDCILVKGSRANRLEKIIDFL